MIDQIRSRVSTLLPTVMILLLLGANGFVGMTQLLPQWRGYEALSGQVDARQTELSVLQNSADPDSAVRLLQLQVIDAQNELATHAAPFLSEGQINLLLDNVYRYADDNRVTVISMQAQQGEDDVIDPVNMRLVRLQATGEMLSLMTFLTRIRETALPGVTIGNLHITPGDSLPTLVFDLLLYTSPFATGEQFAALPTLTPMPTPTALPATPTVTLSAGQLAGFTPAMPPSSDGCPGALAPLLRVGGGAVVDFNTRGSLNVLTEPRTAATAPDTLFYVYDNQRLSIIDGPVCGQWRTFNLWYWRADFGGLQGWVAEATPEDRWLCPDDTPECA